MDQALPRTREETEGARTPEMGEITPSTPEAGVEGPPTVILQVEDPPDLREVAETEEMTILGVVPSSARSVNNSGMKQGTRSVPAS